MHFGYIQRQRMCTGFIFYLNRYTLANQFSHKQCSFNTNNRATIQCGTITLGFHSLSTVDAFGSAHGLEALTLSAIQLSVKNFNVQWKENEELFQLHLSTTNRSSVSYSKGKPNENARKSMYGINSIRSDQSRVSAVCNQKSSRTNKWK